MTGSGFYLPEMNDPDHTNSQNSVSWELFALNVSNIYTFISKVYTDELCE